MAPRKNNNKSSNEAESSLAANKRTRVEALPEQQPNPQRQIADPGEQPPPESGIPFYQLGYHCHMWRKAFEEEREKRKMIEARLRIKEGQVTMLEDTLRQTVAAGETSTAVAGAGGREEEVQSSFVIPDRVNLTRQMICRNCMRRPATMLWFPCRHLCACMVCDEMVRHCPMCNVPKMESFMVNLP